MSKDGGKMRRLALLESIDANVRVLRLRVMQLEKELELLNRSVEQVGLELLAKRLKSEGVGE